MANLTNVEYGADEINALVLDPGYSVVRAGFAGEDAPKSVVPTHYGVRTDDKNTPPSYVFDDNSINNPYANLDIRNPMADDGTVADWEVAAKLWEYAITSRLTVPGLREEKPAIKNGVGEDGDTHMEDVEKTERPMAESPLLMAEPSHNPERNRTKAIEIAMEDWGVPAFYLARSGVLAA